MAGTLSFVAKYDGRGVRSAKKDLKALGAEAAWAKAKFAAATWAIYKFSKTSITAAMEDEKAQAALNNTLKNAGWGRATQDLAAYIDKMQRATGVADDELRPAFTSLFNATENVTISQGMLETAMAVSAGTGKDLAVVSGALAKSLTGNRKALVGLGTGIDTATLKTADLATILGMLDKKFAGATAANAATFAGKMQIVNIAAGEAAETIGGSLIDAFVQIAGDGSVEDATLAMDNFAKRTGDVVKAAGWLISKLRAVAGAAFNLPTTLRETFRGPDAEWDGTNAGKATSSEATRRAQIAAMQKYYAQKKKTAYFDQWLAKWQKLQDANSKKSKADALEALKKENAERAKALRLAKLAAKYDSELINLAAAKKRNAGHTGILGRISDLTTLATANAGLPASASAFAGAQSTQIPPVQIIVQGSVVTERELSDMIADRVRQDNNKYGFGYGKWGGGL